MKTPNILTVAMTGASGFRYGLRLLECLVRAEKKLYVLVSHAAQAVAALEENIKLPGQTNKLQQEFTKRFNAEPDQMTVFSDQEWTAPIASGSAVADAMIVCPCSSGTLSAIANGASNNLIERAADVTLKEKRPLILVPRETPLSEIHLENMLKLSRLSATILPAMPGFYHEPKSIDDLVDFIVARILQQLNIPQTLLKPWG